nr:immunoglobulin light chain junction region [Macaca mulatta]
CQQGKSDPLTF